ncbi:hypothetical protein SEUCBS140593_005494 [Sporothrix eucalyptigena]|uniref:Quercetin 2,3-dioxygenase n=1 Tax=Sporothrix eucalyptigena TaxID=1812306 RepID=A0ABP0BX92_9PEZI
MKPIIVTLLSTAGLVSANAPSTPSLWVTTTPQSPVPYALKKGNGIRLGDNLFPITGNSSGGAFCIMNTNDAGIPLGSVPGLLFPHVHRKTFENFYATKGRVQLWGQNLETYRKNTSTQQTRTLSQGDFGGIPPGTIHTFMLLEPDTELTGVLVPGGFEEFFFHMSDSNANNNQTLPGAGGFDTSSLAKWDVFPQMDFVPRRDVVNGREANGTGHWYDGPNPLPSNESAPIWIAKNYGPKYLVTDGGRYHVVAPLVTGQQTNNTFSQGTITLSQQTAGMAPPTVNYTMATAFLLQEGELEVTVAGYAPIRLIDGDAVFVPANVSFSYHATAEFTKFMYVTGGDDLDTGLIAKGTPWKSAFYPQQSPASSNKLLWI